MPARRRLLLLPGLALLAAAAEMSGRALHLDWLTSTPPRVQFLLLCAGVALVVLGLSGGSQAQSATARTASSLRWTRHELAAVLVITLLALALRLAFAGSSIRVLVDELNFVSGTVSFSKPDERIGLLNTMTQASPFTWLFAYWQAESVALFGRSIAAVRLVSGLVGALAVPALYLLARTLFTRSAALVAALLLATFPPHLHFSRIALLNIADPLMGTLALAFLARGLHDGHGLDYALAGAFLGLTQYFYEGGRLLYAPLAAAWLIGVWRFGVGAAGRSWDRRGLAVMALAAVIVSAPVFYAWAAQSGPLAGRLGASGLNAGYWQAVLPAPARLFAHVRDHIAPAFLVMFAVPEATTYYGGQTPLVLLPLAPFFLLGVGAALRRVRQPGMALALLWLLLTALGNSLLVISRASTRFVVAFPALALVTALGLDASFRWLEKRLRLRARVGTALLFAAAAALALVQAGYYFGPHLGRFDADFRRARLHRDLEDAVYRSLELPPGTQIHIISAAGFDRGYASALLDFFRQDMRAAGYAGSAELVAALPNLPLNVPHAFFIEPEDVTTLRALQARFALEGPFFSPYNIAPEMQFVMFYAPD